MVIPKRFLILSLLLVSRAFCSQLPNLSTSPSDYKDHILFNPHELHEERKAATITEKPMSLASFFSIEIPDRKCRVLKADMQACYRVTEQGSFTFGMYKHNYGLYIDPNQGLFGGWVIDY
jgi:hypothetical protein